MSWDTPWAWVTPRIPVPSCTRPTPTVRASCSLKTTLKAFKISTVGNYGVFNTVDKPLRPVQWRWVELQARTPTPKKSSLNQKPQQNVTQSWAWMLWQVSGEKPWSLRTGTDQKQHRVVYKFLIWFSFFSVITWFLPICGRYYWRIHPQMPEPEQILIRSTWPSLPNTVDAAYENPEKDYVIIFSGGLLLCGRWPPMMRFRNAVSEAAALFPQGRRCGLWMDMTSWMATRSTSTNSDFRRKSKRWMQLCTSATRGRPCSSPMRNTGGVCSSLSSSF